MYSSCRLIAESLAVTSGVCSAQQCSVFTVHYGVYRTKGTVKLIIRLYRISEFFQFLIYIGLQLLSVYVFGLALILLIASLGVSFREIQISTRSLEIYLGAMEKGKIKK